MNLSLQNPINRVLARQEAELAELDLSSIEDGILSAMQNRLREVKFKLCLGHLDDHHPVLQELVTSAGLISGIKRAAICHGSEEERLPPRHGGRKYIFKATFLTVTLDDRSRAARMIDRLLGRKNPVATRIIEDTRNRDVLITDLRRNVQSLTQTAEKLGLAADTDKLGQVAETLIEKSRIFNRRSSPIAKANLYIKDVCSNFNTHADLETRDAQTRTQLAALFEGSIHAIENAIVDVKKQAGFSAGIETAALLSLAPKLRET